MNEPSKTQLTVTGLSLAFLCLAFAFLLDLWGRPQPLTPVPLVDPKFTDPATVRQSYADLKRAGADLSDFDCYACHEKGKPPTLRFDTNHNVVIEKEHETIVMGHGRHNRNNNCFNCHDEQNLEQLQTRDGRALSLADSTPLCGSCHGPTYRDWEAGAHGRTSGLWNRDPAGFKRQQCASCHNPHSPRFPPQPPAPGPHPLRPQPKSLTSLRPTHPRAVPVAQVSNLLYREASSLRTRNLVQRARRRCRCRLEIGDTAGWKPALQAVGGLLQAFVPKGAEAASGCARLQLQH